jgi:hypothetical protein
MSSYLMFLWVKFLPTSFPSLYIFIPVVAYVLDLRCLRFSLSLIQAFNKYRRGNVRGILDPMLTEAVNEDILNKIFDVAFQCVAPTREDRPSMKEVVERLWKIRRDHTKIQRITELTL